MGLSSSKKRVDLSKLASEMGVEITNTTDLVKAIKAGRSYLLRVGDGSGDEDWVALKIPSVINTSHLVKLREKYFIPYNIKLFTFSW